MPKETEQQYTAWFLYCEAGSVRKLLSQWESVWRGFGKSSAELEGIREKLGKTPTRRTLDNWSKQYQWVKRTDLKLAEDLEGLREKTKRIAREKKHKIAEYFRKKIDKALKQMAEGEGATTHEVKEAWEMFQVELGKPTSRTALNEDQRPLTEEEKKEKKKLDTALKIIYEQQRKNKPPILDNREQNKRRKRKAN